MTDFFKKLNLLLRTNLPDLPFAQDSDESIPKLGKNVDREIAALQDRVRDAYAYEDQLKARMAKLQDDVLQLDESADAALADGREEQARYDIEQMKRAQIRLEMTEADLREHQRVTAELVQRVRQLELAVQRAREVPSAPPAQPGPTLEDSLRDAREELESTPLPARAPKASPGPSPTGDDLNERIKRLSK